MGTEIERKFLVVGTRWRGAAGTLLRQGYLNRDPQRSVRVRIAAEQAFITIKGASRGPERAEFEYPVPLEDAHLLLQMCDGLLIEKVRFQIQHGGLRWDVDEFLGQNRGLVLAEVELLSADQPFVRPGWAGEEVTQDLRYFNSHLAAHPYTTW